MTSKSVDRVSMLPEDILSHILSLMPTKHAVRTSILSKRWRYSWMFVTNLNFDDTNDKKIRSEYVDRVMELCKSSQIQLFRVHFSRKCFEKSIVSNWIKKAVGLNVRELDIQVVNLEVPLSMFTCKTLTKLRLNRSHYDQSVWEFPCSVDLPCLKTLEISVFANPLVNAFRLIPGCPMLENLSLKVSWPYHKEDYILNIPTLKRLKLTWLECATPVKKVILRVPNLEYLFVGGVLCSLFVMEDVSCLVEAYVSLYYVTSDHLWYELRKGLSGVKSISIEKIPPHLMPNFQNVKL